MENIINHHRFFKHKPQSLLNFMTSSPPPQNLIKKPIKDAIKSLKMLVDDCIKDGVVTEKLEQMQTDLNKALQTRDPDEVVAYLGRGLKALYQEKPKTPKMVHWFKQFLRFIFNNNKLLQNTDEKYFDWVMALYAYVYNENFLQYLPFEKKTRYLHELIEAIEFVPSQTTLLIDSAFNMPENIDRVIPDDKALIELQKKLYSLNEKLPELKLISYIDESNRLDFNTCDPNIYAIMMSKSKDEFISTLHNAKAIGSSQTNHTLTPSAPSKKPSAFMYMSDQQDIKVEEAHQPHINCIPKKNNTNHLLEFIDSIELIPQLTFLLLDSALTTSHKTEKLIPNENALKILQNKLISLNQKRPDLKLIAYTDESNELCGENNHPNIYAIMKSHTKEELLTELERYRTKNNTEVNTENMQSYYCDDYLPNV